MLPTSSVDEPTGRTRLSPDERRAAILDTTVAVLIEHGVSVTTRQIADAAGVAEGTLFRVFDDKRALLVAAIARAMDPEPVVEALHALAGDRGLEEALADAVEVVATRSADIRAVMAVAHEMRRAAGEAGAHPPVAAQGDPDLERPGSLLHAAHQLRTRAERAPERIVAAIADVLTPHREELRRDPAVCARVLFSIVASSFHDPFGPTNQLTTREVVEVFLDGMRDRTEEPSC